MIKSKNFSIPVGRIDSRWGDIKEIKGKRILLLADFHIPYHSKEAIETMLSYVNQYESNVDTVLINGDFFDCASLSRFDATRNMSTMVEELEIGGEIYRTLKSALPKVKRWYFKVGNHEARIEKYLIMRAPELVELDFFTIENIMKNIDKNVEVIYADQRASIGNGRLMVIHGHELARGLATPVNPARGLFLKFKTTSIMSHSHRVSVHAEKDGKDNQIKCWSTGCLCQLSPQYWLNNSWQHGFAVINNMDDFFSVDNLQIVKNDKGKYYVVQ